MSRAVLTLAVPSRSHQSAYLHEHLSSIRSPTCTRCKLPRSEAHSEKGDSPPRIPAIDGIHSSCCCPDVQRPTDKIGDGPRLRRHSSLWERDEVVTPGLDAENDKRLALPFEAKNMPGGGEAINHLESHIGYEDEDLHVVKANWARGHQAGSELFISSSSKHVDV